LKPLLAPNVYFFTADVTSPASLKAAAAKIRAALGTDPTVLVNNAGVGYDGTILEEAEDQIRRTFEVNTVSHFWTVREFLPAMIRQNHGHVVTIASIASFVAGGTMVDYACSKASALAFHEGLAQELRMWYNAPKVRTSVIHPIWVRTPMINRKGDGNPALQMPVLDTKDVSTAVMKQVLSQTGGQVILPAQITFYSYLRALPWWLQELARSSGSSRVRTSGIWDKSS
jgi:short-subunit dehydrogenase